MAALKRINVRETVGRKNNCKLNFFSMTSFEMTKKYICLLKIADTSYKDEQFEEETLSSKNTAKFRDFTKPKCTSSGFFCQSNSASK